MDVSLISRGTFPRPLVLVVVLAALTDARPMTYETSAMAHDYLVRFGYLGDHDPRTGVLGTEESLKCAVKEFQHFVGLNVTGDLDPETVKQMQAPRCGNKDITDIGVCGKRKRRYALFPKAFKWPVGQPLTYKIVKYTPKLTPAQVDEAVEKAFKVWSDVSQLRFVKKTSGKVHIVIRFASKYHRPHPQNNNFPCKPFDGPGRVLGHAFPPKIGDAHFDDSEYWTVKSPRGVDLFQVAAHEFGHSLGLLHSNVKDALMFPTYKRYTPNIKLHRDDISGIQKLYGASSKASNEAGGICRNATIDAITRTMDRRTYVFKGLDYYRLGNKGVDSGYPRRISSDWDGVTGPVDAALTIQNGSTYIFKGSQYWKFVNQKVESGYPREIRHVFRGIPNNLDSAFTLNSNGKTYFVKDKQYYIYMYAFGKYFPFPLSTLQGLPSTIDAAFKWGDNRTYFFKGGNFYRFNDILLKVDPGYPQSTAKVWFRCDEPLPSELQHPASGALELTNNEDQVSGPVLPDTGIDNTGGTRPLNPDGKATVVLTTVAVFLATLWR